MWIIYKQHIPYIRARRVPNPRPIDPQSYTEKSNDIVTSGPHFDFPMKSVMFD